MGGYINARDVKVQKGHEMPYSIHTHTMLNRVLKAMGLFLNPLAMWVAVFLDTVRRSNLVFRG